MGKRIEIFRVGTHTAADGTPVNFTEADLAASVAAYNPDLHEAPMVIGHPKADAPAYGWVAGLSASKTGGMIADTAQVNADFAEQVKGGAFKKVSASFYLPESPANPAPGNYYLRHVGFLGAQPPAVKGLAPVEFADDGSDCLTVEFGEAESLRYLARLMRSMREWIIEKFGKEEADKALDPYPVEWLGEIAAEQAAQEGAEFSEPEPAPEETKPEPDKPEGEKKLEEKEVKKKPDPKSAPDTGNGNGGEAAGTPEEMEARLKVLEKQNAEFAERASLAECRGIVDKVVGDGRLVVGQTDGLVEFMAGLSDSEGTVEFGEGDEATKLPPRRFMTEFLRRLPRQVDFGERSADDGGPEGLTTKELADKAVEFQERKRKSGIIVSTTDAVQAVKDGKADG